VMAPGWPRRVTQRGNRRMETLFCDDDYRACLGLLAESGSSRGRGGLKQLRGQASEGDDMVIPRRGQVLRRVLAVTVIATTWAGCGKPQGMTAGVGRNELAPFEKIRESPTTRPADMFHVIAEDRGTAPAAYYLYPRSPNISRAPSSELVDYYPRFVSLGELAKVLAILPGNINVSVAPPYHWSPGRRVLRPLTRSEAAQLKDLLLKRLQWR
jgi:hypothetical protein